MTSQQSTNNPVEAASRFSLLPLATVLVCMALVYCMSDAPWLIERVRDIHKDAFTLERSFNQLAIARQFVPGLLALAFLAFLGFKKRFAAKYVPQWDLNFSVLTFLVSVTLVLRLWQCPVASDDAYVDYRYVQHWLAGMFDYNAGDHVMGFTSHLHLLIVWLLCLISQTRAVDMASYFLNCSVDVVNTIFLFFLIYRVYGRILPAAVAAAFYTVSFFSCMEVISGKESTLITLVLLLTMWAVKTSRHGILPWCANALFLFRPEGLLACVYILFATFKAKGKEALKSFVLPCAITLAWYAFLLFYFKTVLPHGMIAKRKVLLSGDVGKALIDTIGYVGGQVTNCTAALFAPNAPNVANFVIALLVFIYIFRALKEPCWVWYRNIVFLQILFLEATRPMKFGWYFSWFTLLGPILAAHLTTLAWPSEKLGNPLRRLCLRVAITLFLVAYVFVGIAWVPFNWSPYLQRGIVYREAALLLAEKTRGSVPVAAADVGMMGYFYPGPILDLMGLVSDEPLKFYPIKNNPCKIYVIPPEAISVLKPKYLMASIDMCQGMLFEDPDFKKNYTEIKRWTDIKMFGWIVLVFERRDQPVQSTETK